MLSPLPLFQFSSSAPGKQTYSYVNYRYFGPQRSSFLEQSCFELVGLFLGQRLFRVSSRPKQKKKQPKEVTWLLSAACSVYWSFLLLVRENLGKWDGFWWDALSDQALSCCSLSLQQQKQQSLLFRAPHLLSALLLLYFLFFSQDQSQQVQTSLWKDKKPLYFFPLSQAWKYPGIFQSVLKKLYFLPCGILND